MPLSLKALLASRLKNQTLVGTGFTNPAQVVAWLGAVQAQSYADSRWAVGSRCNGVSEAAVEQAVNEGAIVRTWAMRGTLHLIAAQDVRWLISLVGRGALARGASTHRRAGLEADDFKKSNEAIVKILRGGRQMIRAELFAALEGRGLSTGGLHGAFRLYNASLAGLMCLGPQRGRQDTYTLIEDWVPKAPILARPSALAELARRFFISHGPASLADFVRWSGLPVGEARSGLEAVQAGLAPVDFQGQTYWGSPGSKPAARRLPPLLLAGYDEYLIGYTQREFMLDDAQRPAVITTNGIFHPTIVVDGRVVGTWSRAAARAGVTVSLAPFAPLTGGARQALARAVEGYGRFLGRPAALAD